MILNEARLAAQTYRNSLGGFNPPAKALIESAYTLMDNLLQPGGFRV